jgi:hypothetical protein
MGQIVLGENTNMALPNFGYRTEWADGQYYPLRNWDYLGIATKTPVWKLKDYYNPDNWQSVDGIGWLPAVKENVTLPITSGTRGHFYEEALKTEIMDENSSSLDVYWKNSTGEPQYYHPLQDSFYTMAVVTVPNATSFFIDYEWAQLELTRDEDMLEYSINIYKFLGETDEVKATI